MKSLLIFAALSVSTFAQDLGGDLTLHRLLIPEEDWKIVAEGLTFADGPTTDTQGNFYFSDMRGAGAGIYRMGADGAKTQLSTEGVSGMKWAADGRLICCQGAKKRVFALTAAKEGGAALIEELATDVQPNDLVVTASGFVYFTETSKRQITRLNLKTKELAVADTGITAPNGIAISQDGGTLAVSDSRGGNTWAFRLGSNGELAGKAPYMTMRRPIDSKGEFARAEPPPYVPESRGDGMCTDGMGRFFVTSALGVQVFDPTGRECGLLPKPQPMQPLTSCAIAGEYLYVTNGDKVFRRKVQAQGWSVGGPVGSAK